MWASLLLIGPLVLGFAWAWYRRPRPAGEPRCAKCGYDIRGLPSPICPECGSDLRQVGTGALTDKTQRRYATIVALWAALCWIGGGVGLSLLSNLPAFTYQSSQNTQTYTGPTSNAYKSVTVASDLYGYGRPPKPWRGHVKVTLTLNDGRTAQLEIDPATHRFKDPAAGTSGATTVESLASWLRARGASGSDDVLLQEAAFLHKQVLRTPSGGAGGTFYGSSMSLTGGISGSSGTSSGFSGPAPWIPLAMLAILSALWLIGVHLIIRKLGARPFAES